MKPNLGTISSQLVRATEQLSPAELNRVAEEVHDGFAPPKSWLSCAQCFTQRQDICQQIEMKHKLTAGVYFYVHN